jgi:caffeoyl-CoA O-methyltransferase
MQISVDQGHLMQFLVRLMGARRCLEVGVYTGYSGMAVALALPAGGRLTAIDRDAKMTAVARRHWRAAGVAGKIDLRLGDGRRELDRLIKAGFAGTYDFAFIDADKENYEAYFNRALELVRAGGLIAVDNTLWHGRVADRAHQDADTRAIRAFNRKRRNDKRVELCMLPLFDGLTLARKRG